MRITKKQINEATKSTFGSRKYEVIIKNPHPAAGRHGDDVFFFKSNYLDNSVYMYSRRIGSAKNKKEFVNVVYEYLKNFNWNVYDVGA